MISIVYNKVNINLVVERVVDFQRDILDSLHAISRDYRAKLCYAQKIYV